jgi:hypothetical protein
VAESASRAIDSGREEPADLDHDRDDYDGERKAIISGEVRRDCGVFYDLIRVVSCWQIDKLSYKLPRYVSEV